MKIFYWSLFLLLLFLFFKLFQLQGFLVLFFNLKPLLFVFLGTLLALLIHFPISYFVQVPQLFRSVFSLRHRDPAKLIRMIAGLAILVQKGGPESILNEVKKIEDPFILMGLRLYLEEVAPEKIEYLLKENISKMLVRHQRGALFFDQIARYAPGFGVFGSVAGVLMLLSNLNEATYIPSYVFMALLCLFYGTLIANLALPIAGRLRVLSREECAEREMVLEGLMAILQQESPGMVKERMELFLSLHERRKIQF